MDQEFKKSFHLKASLIPLSTQKSAVFSFHTPGFSFFLNFDISKAFYKILSLAFLENMNKWEPLFPIDTCKQYTLINQLRSFYVTNVHLVLTQNDTWRNTMLKNMEKMQQKLSFYVKGARKPLQREDICNTISAIKVIY